MATLLLTFVLLLTVITVMAVGVILKGRPIKGSCGGIGALGMGTACDICGGEKAKCEKEDTGTGRDASLAYNAMNKD